MLFDHGQVDVANYPMRKTKAIGQRYIADCVERDD
jgi:hypothetical protein